MADAATKSQYEVSFKNEYETDWDNHRNYINSFDPLEAMLLGEVYDSVSGKSESKITDSYATTLAKERADRVMAKLPDGETQPIGKADVGKAMFMDLLRQKWIYPNANAQHAFQEKLNMWQFYSSVYGYMVMFYDMNVSPSGYVGPDCWLWSPRNFIPQTGRVSVRDMDHATALTWVSTKFIEDIIEDQNGPGPDDDPDGDGDNDDTDNAGWDVDALKELLSASKEKKSGDFYTDTRTQRTRTPNGTRDGVCLATWYEAGEDGEWITFAPDHGFVEVRRLKNPHKNGRIPFVIKYSQALFDSFYGLGDFQRAKPLQFARDGLTNFYFKGIKMNLIPPIVANANGVMKHTLDYREGGVMLETIPNSIRRLETSNAGLSTFQAAQSALTGSLLSMFGSQNASAPGAETLNPSQGKTPQAINLYSDKEATRDGSERRHLESAIEELTDGFFSLVVNVCTEDIPVTLFADDITDIVKKGYTDVLKMFKKKIKPNQTDTAADLTINPKELKGIEYRFNIETDSTAKLNKEAQRQSVVDAIGVMGKMQNVFQGDPRYTIRWDKILQSYESLSDVTGAGEWVDFQPDAQKQPDPQSTPQAGATAVSMGGQVHEVADLVKMYQVTEDLDGKNAIRQALGMPPLQALPQPLAPPAEPTPPTVAPDGTVFHDPIIGQAATALHSHIQPEVPPMPQAEQPTEPTVAPSGHLFNDPHIGQAAAALHAASAPAPIPMPKEQPAVKK